MDPALASRLIAAQFPELVPVRVAWLGEGYDSTAFEVNGEWVFRFPKSDDVAAELEVESRVLAALADRLPLAVPRFRFLGEAARGFARRFCGYAKLAGEPAIGLPLDEVPFGAIAGTIGEFLSALHAFPVEEAASAGVPQQPLNVAFAEIRDEALQDLERVLEVSPEAPIDVWRRYIEHGVGSAAPFARVALVHNDFAAEHILFDAVTQTVTGIIDWSDVALSHPLADFVGPFHWGGEPFARAVRGAYRGGLDENALQCARYLSACRGAMDVAFGLDRGRPEYVAAGLRALSMNARVPY